MKGALKIESINGEIKKVKIDLKACQVCFVSEEGTGLAGVEYTGPRDHMPETELTDGILVITQNAINGIKRV